MEHITPQEREVLQQLDDGPLSHQELCNRLGIHWGDLQRLIRSLRTYDMVRITIDRRYVDSDSD